MSAEANNDVLTCGVHVADIAALVLDHEERDCLVDLRDVAAMFGIEHGDVQAALTYYNENLQRLRPLAQARRRLTTWNRAR